jgi:hypothetical protein
MTHGQGLFDRLARELTHHIGRDVPTESAGSGPSTGKMRTRKSRRGVNSSTEPLASSELASGRGVTSSLGTSDEYTTWIEYSCAEEREKVQMGHRQRRHPRRKGLMTGK